MKHLWFDPHIKAAKAGDDVAARALVLCMARYLRWGKVPPKGLADYFATAFEQIADGRRADDELNTKGKSATFKRHYKIAREVWELNNRAVDRLPLKDNNKKIGAYKTVGDKYHLSSARIKQIYDGMKGLIEAEVLDQPTDPEVRHHLEVDINIASGQIYGILDEKTG
ncbi:hypothetical protein [Pseudomonas sp. Irchel s3b6]|uniref:hypothetical protein n=1 Tax=Pseudomonas sp. Irchel s3b6 TaxID=2009078 RepID=UPI000BA34C1C|nr:hypothetical protein [Pseudomonas sp. Irchel s3b6]